MSFLANLRQQHSDKQTLQLDYWLSHEAATACLKLQLVLQNSNASRLQNRQAYTLNREHLHTPPGFLASQDLNILQSLLALDATFLDKHQFALPPSTPWSLIQCLVGTQRCFFKTPVAAARPLALGKTLSVQPQWQLQHCANYILHWQLQQPAHAFCMAFERHLVYLKFEKQQVLVGATDTDAIGAAAPNYWQWSKLRIPAYPATEKSEPALAALAALSIPIPLPPPPPLHDKDSQVQALLYCGTGRSAQGELSLQISLVNHAFCSLPRLVHPSHPPDLPSHQPDLNEHYWDGKQLWRLRAEAQQLSILQPIRQIINTLCRGRGTDTWQVDDSLSWRQLLVEQRLALQNLGLVFCFAQDFKHRYSACQGWQLQLQQTGDGQIALDIQLRTHDSNIALKDIITQLQNYNREAKTDELCLRLPDGRIVLLAAKQAFSLLEELEDWVFSSQGFCLDPAQSYRLANIQQALPENAEWRGDLDTLNRAIAVKQSPVVLDSQFTAVSATLRPYQWLGVCWLHHLKQQGFNGLLADDMGLGKTLQTIALLAFEKQRGLLQQPCLVVVPLSLLHNWRTELQRFAPQLRCLVIHGNKRHQHWPELNNFDILISTYHSVALDLDHWQRQKLNWLILDEAQHIKNPSTGWSQALKQISSDNRLCLSGTPMENHLGELWSIMDFLMPGCLGNQRYFQQRFRKAIEVDANTTRLQQLLQRIAPFVLRRTKDQIATDLPAKTEIVQRIELDSQQRDFYEQVKQDTKQALLTQVETNHDKGKQQIAALNAILKLRQVCCDPQLLPNASSACPSAKKSHCLEMIQSLVEQQRSILVFSQFTQMLNLLKEALDQRQIDNLSLTGSTKNRAQVVEAFQQGKAPVFLISLKAGGTGLNLTRADTVIHYDPWWNSALQNQASDRAHRIGQDKPVFVYKLIAANTIEEKVEQLQAQKALLSQHIDQQAQASAKSFAVNFEQLLNLFYDDE